MCILNENDPRISYPLAEHCIDILRQATICRADTSMITYWWTDVSRVPETDFFGYHQCVNWDLLMTWFKERYVNVYETGILNHPKYGMSTVYRKLTSVYF